MTPLLTQVYKGLDIVSNKVTAEEMDGVPHHLLGCVPPTEEFSVVDFRDIVLPLIERLRSEGKTPILVGGTHYYIEAALMDRLVDDGAECGDSTASGQDIWAGPRADSDTDAPLGPASHEKRPSPVRTGAMDSPTWLDGLSLADCYAELQRVDPVMANRLHPNDERKIRRCPEFSTCTLHLTLCCRSSAGHPWQLVPLCIPSMP